MSLKIRAPSAPASNGMKEALQSAFDTLIELNTANYTHDDVFEQNNSVVEALNILKGALFALPPAPVGEKIAHKIMTLEEYQNTPIKGWHQVCRDIDGFGNVGVRFGLEQ